MTLSSSPTGLDEGLTSLTITSRRYQLNLTKSELVHLLSRFNHMHVRDNNCTVLHKDVVNLHGKLLNEYYSRSRTL